MGSSDRSPGRTRVDQLVVTLGLAPTRAKAQALILAGRVFAEGRRLDKPGVRISADTPLEITPGPRFVGRGGHKLQGALEDLGLEIAGRDAMDVGSSTGGFTQVLLESGAPRVIALDVGRGLLDWTLRNDPRVHVLEGINARYLEPAMLPFPPGVATIDVSFISLERILPPVAACLEEGGRIIALVKPQFEVGRGKVGKGGIVRDPALHREVLERLARFARERDWGLLGISASRIRGAEGNVEFFVHLGPADTGLDEVRTAAAIDASLARAREETVERDHP